MKKRDYSGNFQCVCGKIYNNSQALKGHQSQCKNYLESKGIDIKEYFLKRIGKNASKQKQIANKKKAIRMQDQKDQLSKWIQEKHRCQKCDKVMTEKWGSGRFCSRQCANSHSKSTESRRQTSISIRSSSKVNERKLARQLEKERIIAEYKASPSHCVICNEALPYDKRNRQTCSTLCNKVLLSKKAKKRIAESGIQNQVDPRFKYGTYKGFHCDSSWELAFVIYCCDHSIELIRCKERFTYIDESGEEHSYFPDFIVDGNYFEIKGWKSNQTDLKIKYFPSDKNLTIIYSEDIKLYMDYVLNIYGKDFIRLYDRNYPSWMDKETVE